MAASSPPPPPPVSPSTTDRTSPNPDPAKGWEGQGETKTFAVDASAFEPDGEWREWGAGTATIDLHTPGDTTEPHVPPAQDRPSRYRVLGEIGRGGVGVVLRAWDRQLGREVALKVLLEAHRDRPDVVRRFLNEARITGRLHHHGVVPIHDFGLASDGRPFFAMRLVQGETFDRHLHRRPDPSVDLGRFLTIFLQVSQAVAYAHTHGVIHRDLKPQNVMVGAFGVVMVMDWGLAKTLVVPEPVGDRSPEPGPGEPSSGCTQMGTVFGTPAYLPPEQARGYLDQVDRRADVFGLGSILCEILTGYPPYTADDSQSVYDKAVAADLDEAFARLHVCPVPLDLVALAKWCLSADLAARPASAADVVEVMANYLQADQRRAELDLVRFFELTLDLFCIAGTDGRFRRVNDNFPRLLGYTAAELIARPYVDFVHPDDRAGTIAVSERMATGQECVRFVNRYRHADGRYIWLEWNARTVLEEQAIYAVARDVTERMAAASEPG